MPIQSDGFDLAFILDFGIYFAFRLYGFHSGKQWAMNFSVDVLAIGESLQIL